MEQELMNQYLNAFCNSERQLFTTSAKQPMFAYMLNENIREYCISESK